MNPAGVVLAIAGIWVISQVFAGNALERLNIIKPSTSDGGKDDGGWVPGVPDPGDLPGVPNVPKVPGLPHIDFGKLFPGSGARGL